MIRATGEGETIADDLVTCLSKAVAATGRPAKILTLSAAPVTNVMAHVFGPAAVETMIVRGPAAPPPPPAVDPAVFATVPRFVDAGVFDRVWEAQRSWLAGAAAIILQFPPDPRRVDDLAAAGFPVARPFAAGGRGTTVFLPRAQPARPMRDAAALAGRPPARRLVIVDPCLGRAAGHYEAYARMLTEGARDLGLEVVWACHAALDAGAAPSGVEVRPVFARCFFDLSAEQTGKVDLSQELRDAWVLILAEFDDAATHILMHSADAHQLRAAAAVFEETPPAQAVVHINFQTSPRFMPGRLAGGDVHAAVLGLRRSPAWERSLFFWAETRRLAVWLSDWLAEEIPAPPLLSARRGAASNRRPGRARVTLAFLGEGRPTKGFLELPDIADQIAARPPLAGQIRLLIQNWPPFRGDLAAHAAAVARLSRHPFVEMAQGVLEPARYEALLDEANLLLLPYDPQTYGLQGSGILVEGLALGKIIVARAGTATADEARAGVGFVYETPSELADGLADIIRDFQRLSASAIDLATSFRENNNPGRFVSALTKRARGLA